MSGFWTYVFADLFCLLMVVTLMLKSIRGAVHQKSEGRFLAACLGFCFFIFTDICWKVMDIQPCPNFPNRLFFNILMHQSYFIAGTITAFLFFLYITELANSTLTQDRKKILLSAIPLLLHVMMGIVNYKTGFLFYMDQGMHYNRGKYFLLNTAPIYLYIFGASGLAVYRALKDDNYADREKLLTCGKFMILPTVGAIAQQFFWEIPLETLGITWGVLLLYLNNLEQMIYVDFMTNLGNRRQLLHFLNQKMNTSDERDDLYFLMMDVDHFKEINDSYGHLEGDAALERIATALKLAVKDEVSRPAIARYGGDEFAMLIESKGPEDVDRICKKIHKCVDKLNKEAESPYQLSVCIGVAKKDSNVENIREFINKADRKLYEAKGQRKEGRHKQNIHLNVV